MLMTSLQRDAGDAAAGRALENFAFRSSSEAPARRGPWGGPGVVGALDEEGGVKASEE